MEVDEVKRNEASMELRVRSAPVPVEGAGGDAGPSECCVVVGAALGRRLAWEGGTPLSCFFFFFLLLAESGLWEWLRG